MHTFCIECGVNRRLRTFLEKVTKALVSDMEVKVMQQSKKSSVGRLVSRPLNIQNFSNGIKRDRENTIYS
jgi:hypothetical protein